ncbi:MAG TPA: hypothetical protein VGM75_04485 [Pseudonocardiaceae bacterium]
MDHRGQLRRSSGYRTAAAALLALATTIGIATSAHAAPSMHTPLAWQENLSKPVSSTNIEQSAGAVRIADRRMHPAAQAGAPGYGMEVLTPHPLSTPVNRIRSTVTDTVPSGARVIVEVRGQLSDKSWTEWAPSPTTFRSQASVVQVRVTLWDNKSGQSPTVSGLAVATKLGRAPSIVAGPHAPAQESYQVYATREGLVGGTTANGHVIVDNDHFVALPSGSVLSNQGTDDYSVQVCGPSACETAPVWDIGPWNIYDDYWDANRAEFTDLAQGTPEAEAAYDNGYNNGIDDEGGTVLNPAGIDLADGTFYDVGLNDNGYVTVTYLWT